MKSTKKSIKRNIKKPALLKKFFYIVAYSYGAYDEDRSVGLRHWRVLAKNKEHAYSVGMAKHDDKISSDAENELLNNYVIAFPKS